ncbi:hypothetical protein M422DRAFT_177649 [Sphaerobolus stellatus SS14]|uniref:EF-hand domain-containing protein n=1 Tax=Sphaerobolus stellatus (strain SS14) TaxID=990650 RepID=A0A0C9USC7_SPHS4|nr:hypothetical protein M422DRAFT_177649 [Sphaerobolus stellatus SS14]
MALFIAKLEIQEQELKASIERQGDRIIAYFSGRHEKIIDPQLREVWKEMGWKGAVKASTFVFALRDYFSSNFKRDPAKEDSHTSTQSLGNSQKKSELADSDHTDNTTEIHLSDLFLNTRNDWAKKYVNIAYLQPIQEAIDDDGSGFVNIQELNDFTRDRPKDWTYVFMI